MAETLDVDQMLANSFEPKKKFRWLLEIDGLDAFTARTADRPKKTIEVTTIDYLNQKRYIPGKGEWQTISMTLYDPVAPSASQKVTQWLRLVHDDPTGRMGYKDVLAKNFSLKLLDPVGNVVEKWNIIGAWPTEVDFGSLDYSDSEAVMIDVTIRYDEARQEF